MMMWELGQQMGVDGRRMAAASSQNVISMQNIHVLLVDHDPDGLLHTVKLLEICQYRVTFVELASAAISLLISGKVKFDVVIENINSPDLHGFKLLQQAVTSGIPVLLMSSDDNAYTAMKYLESGAFLCVKKPVTLEILKCLWQHVEREKLRLNMTNTTHQETPVAASVAHVFREVVHPIVENPNNNNNNGKDYNHPGGTIDVNNDNNGMCNKRSRRRNGTHDDEGESNHHAIHRSSNNVKKKMCTEWTEELHQKFMSAVEKLGEGRCFPKDILELMKVPGLTRMQVASHLQKCRNDNWRSPEERKAQQSPHPASTEDANGSQSTHPKPRRFGSKPLLGKPLSGQQHEDQPNNNPGLETNQMNPGNGIDINNDPSPTPMPKTPSARQAWKKYGSGPGSGFPSRAENPHKSPPNDNLQLAPDVNRNPNSGQPGVFLFNQVMMNNYHPQNSSGGDCRSHWSSGTTTSSSTERRRQ